MTRMSRLVLACLLVGALQLVALGRDQHVAPVDDERPLIQLAILLDTSNSMDGLIDQARTQLWNIVNQFARTQRNGQTPVLQVALYEYGNNGLAAAEGHVRMVVPFTDDLDAVSEQLFALKTNGGQEYCGWVIRSAASELLWSDSHDAYKVIFIAGNEPFTQGPVDYREACAEAVAKGIIVNTIHCGPEQQGISGQWRDGARAGGGQFTCIDQNQVVLAIAAPQDEEIAALSLALNTTYVPYGKLGVQNAQRQVAQDALAEQRAETGAVVARSAAKASPFYRNDGWCLVDATCSGSLKLEDVAEEDLPENMKAMTVEERRAYLDEHLAKRDEIRKKIQALNEARAKYVAEQRREHAKDNTLDNAIIQICNTQLASKGFEIASR